MGQKPSQFSSDQERRKLQNAQKNFNTNQSRSKSKSKSQYPHNTKHKPRINHHSHNNNNPPIPNRKSSIAQRFTFKHKNGRKLINPPIKRVALFPFNANKSFPEQISIKIDEIVLVSEDCGDGWSKVTTENKKLGVVPTSYLGPVTNTSSGQNVIIQKIKQRINILKDMAISSAQSRTISFFGFIFSMIMLGITKFILPTIQHVYHVFVAKNENIQTFSSFVTRSLTTTVTLLLIPVLSPEELRDLRNDCEQNLDMLKDEFDRR